MRRSQPTPEHAEAVSRRLATLSAELAAVRGEPAPAATHTRIRGSVPSEDDPLAASPSGPLPEPVLVPVPGRHASRRLGDRFGPVHLAVVGALVAVALAVAAWSALADRAEPVPVPEVQAAASGPASLPSSSAGAAGVEEDPGAGTAPGAAPGAGADTLTGAGSGAGSGTGSGVGSGSGEVTVDVAGKVRRPGIAVLPAGSRVVDALEAAGGARRGVDLTSLNLARPLVDGEQVLVGVTPPPGVAGTLGAPGEATPAGALVNLNTADQAALESLPGVGPVTATAILDWRTEHGGFTTVDELLEVDGIGDATLADLAPLVTV